MLTYFKKTWKNMTFWGNKTDNYPFLLYLILLLGLIVRVINLNYNSAFTDEAIYIVIGRMGLFVHDWWSYGAKLWMAGLPYIYPPLTALAYEAGGLIGSRFLNVIFGVILIEEVYRFTKLLNIYDEKTNKSASLIAAFLVAFSGIGIFVSRLATYDMLSFLLLITGINSFLKAEYFSNGKYYFLSFFFLFMAFLTKIVIGVFFPVLFILSFFILKQRTVKHRKIALIYLYLPFIIGGILYLLLYGSNLMAYVASHKGLGSTQNYMDIVSLIWEESKALIIVLFPSGVLLILKKKIKLFAALLALSLCIPVFHLALLRFATLDKHLYLTVIFLSVLAGYGIAVAVFKTGKPLSIFTKLLVPLIMFYFLYNSYQVLFTREHEWQNTTALQKYLVGKVQPGDKVLTEEGGVVILSLYDKIFPPKDIVTFDWIDYSGLQGDLGYTQAVSDGYFNYIQLDNQLESNQDLSAKIRKSLAENYSLTYKKDVFQVYERNDK